MHANQEEALFHYKTCGLDNIFLVNGFKYYDTGYGKGVSISDMDGLHAAIAKSIIYDGTKPSGQEIRFLRKELGISQAGLAMLMLVDAQTVARWEKDQTEIPGPASTLLRLHIENSLSGKELLSAALQKLADLDEHTHGQIMFKSTEKGWRLAA